MAKGKIKKPQKLSAFFMRYTGSIVLVFLGVLLLTGGLFSFFYAVDFVQYVPMDQATVERIVNNATRQDKLQSNVLPSQSIYAVFTQDGDFLYGNADAPQRALLWNRYAEMGEYADHKGIILQKDAEIRIATFENALQSSFRFAWLQRLFPNPNTLFFTLGIMFFLFGVVFSAFRHGKIITHELSHLHEATVKIQEQDLDFAIQPSSICEVDAVLDAMGKMKNALASALTRQWEMEQARREQTAALVHDTQTPVTIIKGNAELLLECDSLEKSKQYGMYIVKNAQLISDYMDALRQLDVAEKEPTDSICVCDAAILWQELADMLRAVCAPKRIMAQVQPEAPQGIIQGDAADIQRAFANILSNAVYYTPTGQAISLRYESGDGHVSLILQDSGPGFSKDALHRAAELSYTEKPPKEGRGLGLYTASSLAQANSGRLSFGNASEGGARVGLTFLWKDHG